MPRPDPDDTDTDDTFDREGPGAAFSLSLPPQVSPFALIEGGEARRYEERRALGKGSMGEVVLCHDARIGRDVAMKRILRDHADAHARARFLREARVQGQLEHPSVVPVYDLGDREEGAPFFTMKCLRGLTLAEILKALAAGDAAMSERFPRHRLLAAFASACLAVDFAHSRGVVHRDLKPANLMLGEYGEVYLLDWGIAKLTRSASGEVTISDDDRDNVRTQTGKILGTWGYMPPEQARGRVDLIDARSDVYALGAVLFEILALAPLHKKDVWSAMLMATVQGVPAKPSLKAPKRDVPPELDEVCVRATHLDPAERFQSARALHDAIERFLQGDRDVELRRQMAASHARGADEAVARAATGGPRAEEELRAALSEAGRALAIEPGNGLALHVLGKILTAAPREIPAEVTAEMDAHAAARHRVQLREAIHADLAAISLMTPIVLWMGVRDVAVLVACVVLTFAASAAKLLASRQPDVRRMHQVAYVSYLLNVLALACVGRGFGPLLFTPMLLTAFTFAYCMTYKGGFRAAVVTTGAVSILASFAAELGGLAAPSYAFHDGAMTILPRGVTFPAVPTLVGLLVASVFMVIVPGVLMGRIQTSLKEAELRAFVQSWRLRQLLPDEARTPTPGA